MKNNNNFFQMIRENGLRYLVLYPNNSCQIDFGHDDIKTYFYLNNISNYDKRGLQKYWEDPTKEAKILIGDRIDPIDEKITIEVSEDWLEATAVLYPSSEDGKQLTKQDILAALIKNGVNYGTNHKVIDQILEERCYFKRYCIAKGKKMVQGENARIVYHFNINKIPKPRVNEDGSVDYHHLDMITPVKKGDHIATIVPERYGEKGILLNGKEILPAQVKKYMLKQKKNIIFSEDGTKLYSGITGQVYLLDDAIFLSETYEINGNVDASTGDIHYDGDVVIRGNVVSGYRIYTTGQIVVEGIVEGASIEADGPIILKGGVQGRNQAQIKSKDMITAKFIESANVLSECSIQTEAILHSKVYAKESVHVVGRRGLIVGSEVKCSDTLEFKVAGSVMGTKTFLEVGLDPSVVNRHKVLTKEIPELEAQKRHINEVMLVYQERLKKGIKISQEQLGMLRSLNEKLIQLNDTLENNIQEKEILEHQIQSTTGGKIIVNQLVYPGVVMEIGKATKVIKNETKYCKFVNRNGDVTMESI